MKPFEMIKILKYSFHPPSNQTKLAAKQRILRFVLDLIFRETILQKQNQISHQKKIK